MRAAVLARAAAAAAPLVRTAPLLRQLSMAVEAVDCSKLRQQQDIAEEINSLFADVDEERIRSGVKSVFADGKYRYLMKNVIATPSNLMAAYNSIKKNSGPLPPDEARQLAADGITPEVIRDMGKDLRIGIFDVGKNCIELPVSSKQGSTRTLVIPNLKLKIAMQATRMALQEVYEPRFSNFSFGYRPGRNRHMALRFIKYRWKFLDWFVKYQLKQRFMGENMDILATIMEETIEDTRLISFLRQLFRHRVLQMDMGDMHWDCSKEPLLSPILLNIYLDKLDSRIMELAHGVAAMNPDRDGLDVMEAAPTEDIGIVEDCPKLPGIDLAEEVKGRYKVYACRYGDELLLAITGQKELAFSIQQEVALYLCEKLMVEVDRGRGPLREAGACPADFLGFTLKFVPPTAMPGYKKQATIQAMRKVQHRVEEVKRQQKEHWESTMLKLGGKMLVDIFKRTRTNESSAQRSEQTVKRMFQSVAGDIVRTFLQSPDHKQRVSERFKKGHALLSPWIRQQLPKSLTDAYDRFQEQLDMFLGDLEYTTTCPDVALKLRDRAESLMGIKPVEQREDELRMTMVMPEHELIDKLRGRELADQGGHGMHMSLLVNQEDIAIVQWYASIAKRWLDYYRCADNFAYVKKAVDYQLRYSMICTLCAKHKCTVRNLRNKFSPELKVLDLEGNMVSYYPTASDLRNLGKKFLCPPQFLGDTKTGDGVLYLCFTRMSRVFLRGNCCSVIGCYSSMVDMYLSRVFKLRKRIFTEEDDWIEVVRVGTLHSVYDWKSLPLCFEHYLELLSGRVSVANVRAEAWNLPVGKGGKLLPHFLKLKRRTIVK